jgi:hypothetical protein
MEFGRSNMAIISLYSILGSAMTRNFDYMVGRRTPQISNIAINSLNSIFAPLNSNKDGILDIEFSDPIAIFDIRDAIYIRIQGSEYRI